ncbi:MAG: hypothetical protein HY055_10825 [Magnetospirillum sp.]|nr:hypothetical protein [Magnetospirillum sp.]
MASPLVRNLAATALGLGLLLPLASLPVFALGAWDKAEPLVIGLHLCAALAAFALAAGAVQCPALVVGCLRHPFVLLPLALAAWSAAAAPFVALPWLSLAGAPQSGQGGLWPLDFALLIAVARMVRQDGLLWRRLGLLAVASVAVVAALKAFDWGWGLSGGRHLLIWVAAYYGWLGLVLPVLVLGDGEERGRWWRWLVLAVAVAVVLASRTLAIGAAGLLGLAAAEGVRRRLWGKGGAVALTGITALLPGLLLAMVPVLRSSASLADRYGLLLMLRHEMSGWGWTSWLTGLGWGRTQDVFHKSLHASGMRLWDGSWTFMTSDYFHSHNVVLEALLSAGVPGALLSLGALMALPLACDPARRAWGAGFAVALAGAGAIWFPLGLSLPALAMAVAALAPPPFPARAGRRLLPMVVFALVGMALAGWAGLLLRHGLEMTAFQNAVSAGASDIPDLPADPRGGDLEAAEIISHAFLGFESVRSAERGRYLPAARSMADYLRRRLPETQTVLLPVSGLSLMAQTHLLGGLTWLGDDLDLSGQLWMQWIDMAWRLAPERGDLAIPLFTRMATTGRSDLLEAGVQRVLSRDPRDPVGLYFHGLLLVQSPDPAVKRAGIDRLRSSIESGLDRFMPLDPALAPLLRQQ